MRKMRFREAEAQIHGQQLVNGRGSAVLLFWGRLWHCTDDKQ